MARSSHRLSLFSQRLDRAAFIAYFLGAVVPFMALAYLAQKWLLPAFPDSRPIHLGLIVSIGALSLASFLALRRTAQMALARVNRDNQRLLTLLRSSRSLATASHDREIWRIAATCAAELTAARGAYFARAAPGKEQVEVVESAGIHAQSLFESHCATLTDLARRAIDSQRPAFASPGAPTESGSAEDAARLATAIGVPCCPPEVAPGAVLVVLEEAARGEEKSSIANVLSTLARLASVALHSTDLKEAQRNFFTHVTHLLVGALDAHLDYKADHSRGVARLAGRLGRSLGFEEDRLQRLHFAALLHDIGMLEVDRLRMADRKSVRQHPGIGYEMLHRIRLWEDLAPVVLHHHEWYDGTGYPDGLAGDEIPLESRIIGLAEAFDSMTNASSYQPQISVSEALDRIETCSGSQFDPELVRLFADLGRDEALE